MAAPPARAADPAAEATRAWDAGRIDDALAWSIFGLTTTPDDPDLQGIAGAAWGAARPKITHEHRLHPDCDQVDRDPRRDRTACTSEERVAIRVGRKPWATATLDAPARDLSLMPDGGVLIALDGGGVVLLDDEARPVERWAVDAAEVGPRLREPVARVDGSLVTLTEPARTLRPAARLARGQLGHALASARTDTVEVDRLAETRAHAAPLAVGPSDAFAVSPHGGWVAAVPEIDGPVRRAAVSGPPAAPLPAPPGWRCGLAVSDQGDVAVGYRSGELWWAPAGGTPTVVREPAPCDLAFDGARLQIAGGGLVRYRRPPAPPVGRLPQARLSPGALVLRGSRLLVTDDAGGWVLHRGDRSGQLATGITGLAAPVVAADLRGDWVTAVMLDASGGVAAVDVESSATRTIPVKAPAPSALAFAPDGQQIAIAGRDGAVSLRGLTGSDLGEARLPLTGSATGVAWSPDSTLWVTGPGQLAWWSPRSDTQGAAPLPTGAGVVLAHGPSGDAFVAFEDASIGRLSGRTGELRWRTPTGIGPVTTMSTDRNGSSLLAADAEGRVVALVGGTGAVRLRTPSLGSPLKALVESTDGALLAIDATGAMRVIFGAWSALSPDLLEARFLWELGLRVIDGRVVAGPRRSTPLAPVPPASPPR
jgi:hypothetical protein